MAKPVIWTIDDDPAVLRSVERDLRRQYANRYRIMAADSGEAALAALAELKLRNDVVALFLVDQRMPGMSGVEFLEQALAIYPNAKRALLTAYADTDAAILREHWPGSDDVLTMIQKVLGTAESLVGTQILDRIKRMAK